MKIKYFAFLVVFICLQNRLTSSTLRYKITSSPNFKSIEFLSNGLVNESFKTLTGKFEYFINEPTKIGLRLNDESTYRYIWLENKAIELTVSNNLKNVNFKNSTLNDDYIHYQKLIDSFTINSDELRIKLLAINSSEKLYEYKVNEIIEDSLNTMLYNWCLNHTNSFICFDFIEYQLQESHIDKSKLRQLFSVLDTSLYKYPSYKKYKELLRKSTYEVGDTVKNFKLQLENRITDFNKNTNKTSYTTKTILTVNGQHIENYQLQIDNEIYIDTLKKVNIINKEIAEPLRVSIMNTNDTIALMNRNLNYIFFYLDIGTHEITIDVDKSTITSKTSKLNTDYNEFWQLKKKEDTLMETAAIIDSIENSRFEFRTNNNRFDSISHLYQRAYYNKCMQLPKSFISLSFVKFLSGAYFQAGISKQEVVYLFNSLDSCLFKYPTYIETKKIMKENFINNRDAIPTNTINKPLWNPK